MYPDRTPPGGAGYRGLSLGSDVPGSDPFGLGVILHVDPLSSFVQIEPAFASDEAGQGAASLPVPAHPGLAGATVFAQAVWTWTGPCQPSLPGLSSSAGLRLTVQP